MTTSTERAILDIIYDQLYELGVGCFLTTSINQIVTYPGGAPSIYNLRKCLVVKRAGGYAEAFTRIATVTDLTTLEELPTSVNILSSPTYTAAGPQIGDIIHMGVGTLAVPPVWEYVHNFIGSHTYTVTYVAPFGKSVTVTPSFPDYGAHIGFYVMRGGVEIIPVLSPASDGFANRDYTGTTGTYFLTSSHSDFLSTNIDEALDFIDARKSEAQSIVTELNQDAFTGSYEELYE